MLSGVLTEPTAIPIVGFVKELDVFESFSKWDKDKQDSKNKKNNLHKETKKIKKLLERRSYPEIRVLCSIMH